METKTTLLIAIIILLVVILLQEEIENYSKGSEHLGTWGNALMEQSVKLPVIQKVPDETVSIIKNELSNRLECMTSPERNGESPLESSLHGHSAMNAL